jgi:membrane protein
MRFVKHLYVILEKTITRWSRNDGNLLAASMAYYAAFSFYPLLLVLMSVLSYALEFSASAQNARQQLLDFLARSMSPALAEEVGRLFNGDQGFVLNGTGWRALIAPLILLIGAIGIFSQLETAFDRLWHAVTPHERGVRAAIINALWNRLKAFLTLIGLGLVVIVAFVAQLILSAVQGWAEEEHLSWAIILWPRIQIALSLLLNAIALALVFKMIPRAAVRWVDALIGGLAVAVSWQIGAQIVSRYIVGGHYTAYGVVGSFIAMMLWVYCASILLFLGAQLVQVLGHPEENVVAAPTIAPTATNGKEKPAEGIKVGKK